MFGALCFAGAKEGSCKAHTCRCVTSRLPNPMSLLIVRRGSWNHQAWSCAVWIPKEGWRGCRVDSEASKGKGLKRTPEHSTRHCGNLVPSPGFL